uniref:Uncharacterized protein n=1 Tax=Oryza sativa subsp. japonica TaxID=39947 RepID=Q8L4G5_ORYSJ|nr:hypothetical protein [Oryza sativa Japonica Group]BAD30668.1 hypothetical protein [Oryza sativa Japonica Group]
MTTYQIRRLQALPARIQQRWEGGSNSTGTGRRRIRQPQSWPRWIPSAPTTLHLLDGDDIYDHDLLLTTTTGGGVGLS